MLERWTAYNEGELLFAGSWGPAALWIMAAAGLVVLALTWLDLEGLSPRRRATILGLRTFALGLALLLLLEPAVELREVRHVPNHVPILVDASESQSVRRVDGQTRWELAMAGAAQASERLASRGAMHQPHLFVFGDTVERSSIEALGDHPVNQQATDLLGALDEIERLFDPRDIGGVLLLSDGIDNRELGDRVPRGERLDARTRERLERAGYPVHTVATGHPGDVRDVAIERVYHEEFAFIRNTTRVEADIRVLGYAQGSLPITLRREGEALQTRTLRLEEGQDRYRVSFEFVPEQMGRELFTIEAPVLEGEAIARNNRAAFVIRTIRDRIRGLHVAGRPSWDQRYLRQHMRDNPNIDLISFFILRSSADTPRAGNNELSLIAFPVDELFTEQLGSFDFVIFQNFTHVPYYMSQYLPNIARYVRDGGGFVMVGGEQSFASGGFAGTPVEGILPVRLPTTREGLVDRGAFQPNLTEAGHRHPITRFDFQREENERIWRGLPALTGTNLLGRAHTNATVLATHPTRRVENEPMPVIAVSDVGQGRSMAISADSLWRWSFDNVGDGGTSREFNSFWNNAIRWLIRDPELNLLQLDIPQSAVRPGEEVQARVRIFETDYQPAGERPGRVEIRLRSLDALGEPGEVRQSERVVSDERGVVDVRFVAEEEGIWDIHVRMEAADEGLPLEAGDFVLAQLDDREIRDLEARPELLEAVAEASGGRATVREGGRIPQLELRPARVLEIDRRELIQLWSHPLLLALFVLLLGGEWLLRRRWGRL